MQIQGLELSRVREHKRVIVMVQSLTTILLYGIIGYILLAVSFFLFSESVIFQPPPSTYSDINVTKIPLPNGGKMTAIYLSNPKAKYTILLSHGNAEDLGTLLPLLHLFVQHGFSILAYDYEGYGTSSGSPSVSRSYQDIEAAYDYLISTLHLSPQSIILYGRSVGSGPTTYLASKKPVRAMILESPFISAYRVMTSIPLFPFDKYPNLANLEKINLPLLVIHGKKDRTVPLWHGKKVFEKAKGFKQAYWVEGGDHNDLLMVAKENYWQAIKDFVTKIDQEETEQEIRH